MVMHTGPSREPPRSAAARPSGVVRSVVVADAVAVPTMVVPAGEQVATRCSKLTQAAWSATFCCSSANECPPCGSTLGSSAWSAACDSARPCQVAQRRSQLAWRPAPATFGRPRLGQVPPRRCELCRSARSAPGNGARLGQVASCCGDLSRAVRVAVPARLGKVGSAGCGLRGRARPTSFGCTCLGEVGPTGGGSCGGVPVRSTTTRHLPPPRVLGSTWLRTATDCVGLVRCCRKVAAWMLRSADDPTVVVVMAEVPGQARIQPATTTPTGRAPRIDDELVASPCTVVCGVVSALLAGESRWCAAPH